MVSVDIEVDFYGNIFLKVTVKIDVDFYGNLFFNTVTVNIN